MLICEEYMVSGHPGDVLDALSATALARGWKIEEDRLDRFFALEDGVSVRTEPRKILVSAEQQGAEAKLTLVAWCSGFTLKRFDGKLDLVPELTYETKPLGRAAARQKAADGHTMSLPAGDGTAGDDAMGPSWVRQVRLVEFGLLALSFAALAFFVAAIVLDWPRWEAGVGLAIAAVTALSSGLALDYSVRHVLDIPSRNGMKAQVRRAGFSAVVAVLLLVWLWRM